MGIKIDNRPQYILNTNEKIVNAIEKRLEQTNGQCPCVAPQDWTEDTLCPCRNYRESNDDVCHCQLYIGKI